MFCWWTSPSKSEHERCYRWYLKVFQIHLTDHHDIILDDPTGPAKIGILRALLDAEQILMYLSTSLKPSKQAVLLDQRLDKIKASLPIANQKRRKCSPRLPWLQGLDAMVVNLLCTPSAPGEQLCLSRILTWSRSVWASAEYFRPTGGRGKKPGEIFPCQRSSKYQLYSAGQSSITFHLRSFLYPHRRRGREHLGLDVFLKCKKLLDNGLWTTHCAGVKVKHHISPIV